MSLGSIRNAYEVYQRHDFSLSNYFRLISILGAPEYVSREINEKPYGEGGALYIKSASIPGRTVQNIPVPYQGFEFNKPGAVKYDNNPWQVTFKTPGDYLVRNALEQWSFEIASDETSCGRGNIPCPNSVIRLGLTDASCKIIRVYDLIGVYPSNVSSIEYDMESTSLTQFTVDFYYQYWRLVPNFDTGIIDSTTVEQAKIQSTYDKYHGDIMQTDETC